MPDAGDAVLAFDPNSTLTQLVPIDKIVASPYQSRKGFDPDELKILADSMAHEGLINPIMVRKNGEIYELIAGERRLRAAQSLGWREIEAKVIKTISEGEAAAKALIENLHRSGLNPIEEAEGFKKLNDADKDYWTQRRISQVTGKLESYVSESLNLLSLPEAVKESFVRTKLPRSHGLQLARLPTPELQLQYLEKIENLSVNEARKLIDKVLGKAKKPAAVPDEEGGDPMAEIWKELKENPHITDVGAWKSHYVGKGEWCFVVRPSFTDSSDLRQAMAAWFRAVAQALED